MKKYKAIFFDLDGTLVDTDVLIIQTYLYMFKKYRPDYKPSLSELISFLGPTLKSQFPKYFKEDLDLLIKDYVSYSHDHHPDYVRIYDGVVETLNKLKKDGYKLGVITSKFKDSMMTTLNLFDLAHLFDVFITLNDVNNPKPDPEGINKAIKIVNVISEEILYVGDNITDYQAAMSANVDFALVSWSVNDAKNKVNPTYLINSYQELYEVITNGKN